jgi:hypothetical protein
MDSDDDSAPIMAKSKRPAQAKCPYLNTINRPLLDFDMQKLCSITLTPNNVYACLVCGRFFEGRGRHTYAYTHACEMGHHVFINLADTRVYCLPDGYEVTDASLTDIKFALSPKFEGGAIASLDRSATLSTDVLGVTYLPGFIGLNNLKHTDFVNVVVQVSQSATRCERACNYTRVVIRFAGIGARAAAAQLLPGCLQVRPRVLCLGTKVWGACAQGLVNAPTWCGAWQP